MQLLLVRHAHAESSAATDAERRLTEKGRRQAERLARFLHALEVTPDRILTSPYLRAVGTAEHLQKRLAAPGGLLEVRALASGMTPEEGCALLADCLGDNCAVFVGHEPDCSAFAAFLTGMESPEGFTMKKAACAFFHVDSARRGGAHLTALVPPRLLADSGF